jgi:hypothetical protein
MANREPEKEKKEAIKRQTQEKKLLIIETVLNHINENFARERTEGKMVSVLGEEQAA